MQPTNEPRKKRWWPSEQFRKLKYGARVLLSRNQGQPETIDVSGRPTVLMHAGEGTPFVPADPYARAQVLQRMFFEQYDHEPAIAVVRFWLAYSGRPEEFEPRRLELITPRALDDAQPLVDRFEKPAPRV